MESYALPVQVYGAGLIFARVGALVMLLPGIGETAVPPRIRLGIALLLSLMLYPVLSARLPSVPTDLGGVAGQVIVELLLGLAIGAVIRFFLGSLAVAGEVISLQTTLAFAQTTNPLQAQPSTSVSTFLTVVGLTLVFSTDLHQLFIAAIVKTYTLFPPGGRLPTADLSGLAVRAMGETFALGIQLSAPILVFSLVIYVAAGLIGRMMPQFQVFFVATPLIVLLGLSILALGLGVIGLVWVDHLRAFVGQLG